MFRILSVEVWLVLVISIVIAAILTKLVCEIQLHVRVARVQDIGKFVDQPLGCHSRCVCANAATHTVTTFTVPRMDGFLSCLQHSVPGISHNISY